MSRAKILTIYILFDLLIVAGVLWCAVHRIPVRTYLLPAAGLFILGGVWLIVMTVRHTSPPE
jgi:hypothetical protein